MNTDTIYNLANVVVFIPLLVLIFRTEAFRGRQYLIAYLVLTFVPSGVARLMVMWNSTTDAYMQNRVWFVVSGMFYPLALTALGVFILANMPSHCHRIAINLFSFEGRIRRIDFWLRMLILVPATQLPGLYLIKSLQSPVKWEPGIVQLAVVWLVVLFISLVTSWATLATHCKRWHDLGRSGWWTLAGLIPIAGPVFLLYRLGFWPGEAEANEYGPSTTSATSAKATLE